MDKNLLYDGSSIGKVKLCVKTKAITLYAHGAGLLFLRKVRDVDQGGRGGRVNKNMGSALGASKIQNMTPPLRDPSSARGASHREGEDRLCTSPHHETGKDHQEKKQYQGKGDAL